MAAKAVINQVASAPLKYFLGNCLPSMKSCAARVRIPKFVYDENLHMHFRDFEIVYAHDPDKKCKSGDLILIQSLPEKMTRLITHKVIEIIYPLGDVTDPVTGKKVVVSQYRDNMKFISELHGKNEEAYNYDTAEPRGRLEDVRDFTHVVTHNRLYKNKKDDPQPYAV